MAAHFFTWFIDENFDGKKGEFNRKYKFVF